MPPGDVPVDAFFLVVLSLECQCLADLFPGIQDALEVVDGIRVVQGGDKVVSGGGVIEHSLVRQSDVHQLIGHSPGVACLTGDSQGLRELFPCQLMLPHAQVHDARVAGRDRPVKLHR